MLRFNGADDEDDDGNDDNNGDGVVDDAFSICVERVYE